MQRFGGQQEFQFIVPAPTTNGQAGFVFSAIKRGHLKIQKGPGGMERGPVPTNAGQHGQSVDMMGVQQRVIRVFVWDKPCDVTVTQQAKSVWIAQGEYLGKHYETRDRTPGAAAKRWAEMARYATN